MYERRNGQDLVGCVDLRRQTDNEIHLHEFSSTFELVRMPNALKHWNGRVSLTLERKTKNL